MSTDAVVGLWVGGAIAVGIELLPKAERGNKAAVVACLLGTLFWPVYVAGRFCVFWSFLGKGAN